MRLKIAAIFTVGLFAMWFGTPPRVAAQNTLRQESFPTIVYVSNGGGGITEVNAANNSVIATAPFTSNANGVVVTPDGRWMYATNRDIGQVTVFSTATNVPLTVIPVGNGNDNLGLAISPDGSQVYVANQISGTVTVIATATNTVTRIVPTGVEPIWITFSPDGARAYVSNQVSGTISVISTSSGSVITNIPGFSCPFQSEVTRDRSKLLVSSQCDNSLKVVNLATNTVVNSLPTGPNPRGIALTPDGTRAYVADWFSNTVDIIDVASQTNLNTPITVGASPWGIAMTPEGKAYVANFGDNTISVIDTTSNTVTATLPSRGNPEDVTVSTTARPQILNYSFQTFDPPGSVDSVAHTINSHGQIVGRYQDGGGVVHGYLRHPDGSFVTIDPPGSILTVAFGINDAGVAAGIWQDASGTYHGFTRSLSGLYTTTDAPGAVDSEFTGINNQGAKAGDYDLGDLATSISFIDVNGNFTPFEDPSDAPMQTAALGINSQNFVSGLFLDAGGTDHGFVRSPSSQIENFDFPISDFTDGYKMNDYGRVVGQYATNFPNHGFILSGAMNLIGPPSPCQFFSFDYPDSQATGNRGINNLGQLVGFYRVRGNPARHGFLATRAVNEDSDHNNTCPASGIPGKRGADLAYINYPGAANTQATAITPAGEIVGRYFSSDGKQHGFILRGGQYAPVDVPTATNSTDVAWVNDRGEIVGTFGDAHGAHAYALSKGKFTTIDYPGADPANTATLGFGISNAGDVVGVEFVGGDFIRGHGYVFSHGAFSLIDYPGAVGTFPTMILDSNRIVGAYFGGDSAYHSFLLSGGKFTNIDVPNSTLTWMTGINQDGDIVGFYNSADGIQHGVVLRDGTYITVDIPGAISTESNGIDPQGDVVGRYVWLDGTTHGYFLRCAACTHHQPRPSHMQ
jgi:YVTN family beta-propeller protein